MQNIYHQETNKSPVLNPDYLTCKEAASYLGISVETLYTWRCTHRYDIHRIPYMQIGRLIKYKKKDLDEWLLKQVKTC